MRDIRFKRAFFFDEAKTKFSHFDTWGVNIDGANFKSPSSNNYAQYFTDCQFSDLKDTNGVEIFAGDIMQPKKYLRSSIMRGVVVFKNDGFKIKGSMYGDWYLHKQINNGRTAFNDIIVIGNIYENPELINALNQQGETNNG